MIFLRDAETPAQLSARRLAAAKLILLSVSIIDATLTVSFFI